MIRTIAIALLSSALPAIAQDRSGPEVELGLHGAGLRGDSFSTFETRLLAGGSAIAEAWKGWGLGVGLDLVWVDQEATSYLYRVSVRRALPSFGGVEPYLATGVGGLTTRLDVRGVHASDSDWLVPIAAGARWRKDVDTSWGVRAEFTDLVVWEEVPCDCVNIGYGPTPETGDTSATHNLAVSAGVFLRLGGESP
jgi:hypothetical protein